MVAPARMGLLIGVVCVVPLLCGCPGMPGGPSSQQKMAPGILPPPGLESGGARTLMGTTITPPDNYFLLVKYTYAHPTSPQAADLPAGRQAGWQTCRRAIPLDTCILVEGLNYDGRLQGAEKDVNQLLPFSGLTSFYWKYEPKPAPPPQEQPSPQGKRPRK